MSRVHPSLWEMTSELPPRPKFTGEITTDVAIIGGGITGLTLAYLLRHSGLRICVLERHKLGSGTTGGTSAHLSTLWDKGYSTIIKDHGLEHAKTVFSAMSSAIEFVYQVSQLSQNQSEFGFVDGYLYQQNESQLDLSSELQACEKIGMPIIPITDEFPLKIVDGLGVKTQGKLHPLKHLGVLLHRLEEANIAIYENSGVISIEGNEIRTTDGIVRATHIVHATHTPAGFNLVQAALKPYRSYLVAGKYPQGLPDGLFMDRADPYHYIRKYMYNHETYLVVGGCDTRVGQEHDLEQIQLLENYARENFNIHEFTSRWSAQLYEPTDGLPIIGKDPKNEGHYLATGFSGDGLTMGTAAALMIADLIIKGSHPWEEYFSPARRSLLNLESFKCNLEVGKNLIKDRLSVDHIDPQKLSVAFTV